MAKTIGRLTHQLVGSAALEPGLYGDGGNLYLRVGKDVVGEDGVVKDGGRSWVFIYRYDGKQRELGLGRAGKRKGAVSLADARATAKKGRAMLDQQPPVDPRTVWRAQPKASARTFAEAAKDYIAEKEAGWKNAKHIAQWRHTIKVYCQPLAQYACRSDRRRRRALDPDADLAARAGDRVAGAGSHRGDHRSRHAGRFDAAEPGAAIGQKIRQGEGGRQARSRNRSRSFRAAISPPCPTKTPRLSPGACATRQRCRARTRIPAPDRVAHLRSDRRKMVGDRPRRRVVGDPAGAAEDR